MAHVGLQTALGKPNHRSTCSIGSPHANETTNFKRGRATEGVAESPLKGAMSNVNDTYCDMFEWRIH